MTLFEKLKNKRYDLQEAPIDNEGNITPKPGEIKKSEKLLRDINKKLSASTTKGDQARSQYGTDLSLIHI